MAENKAETAKLFEEKKSENTAGGSEGDSIPNTFSMTQMLGLCSGKFDDSNPSTLNSSANKTNNNDGDDNKVGEADSSSLNFHDDNANASFANFTLNQSASAGGSAPDDESTSTCGQF